METPKLLNVVRRTLLGEGDAFVAGLPSDFVLAKVLAGAKRIQLATAIACLSGWQHFRQGITNGAGSAFLLTGLDLQTEPALLKEWLQLQSKEPKRIEAKLASRETFFHPKVLIVTCARPHEDFAIVGSGNLSQRGMRDNTECCVYLRDAELVKHLASWFEVEFDKAVRLNEFAIKEYEPYYKRNRERRRKLEDEQRLAQKKVRAVVWDSGKALQEAKKFFASPQFALDYASRQRGRADILKALQYPDFTFDRLGFKEFFSTGALGRLNPLNRETIFRKAKKIQKGLRMLIADVEANLPLVLNKDGSFYVRGFRLNAVTKVLAAHDPKTWFLFNGRVEQVLRYFGYPKPRGSSTADQYLRYKDAMEKLKEECKYQKNGGLDAMAWDAFVLHYSVYLDKKYGKRRSSQAHEARVKKE
jgi:phospholipase D-like protein